MLQSSNKRSSTVPLAQTRKRSGVFVDDSGRRSHANVPAEARFRVAVVGGGIAGVAAATVLAERGAKVTLFERNRYLGGRAGAWTEELSTGEPFEMERGFHAFFRQYYNLRSLLRRVDPTLARLKPVPDYPLIAPNNRVQSFKNLPKTTPLNLLSLVLRSPALRLKDFAQIRPWPALEMLRYQDARMVAFDHVSAKEYLDACNFPEEARMMLFEVFAHSFFNDPAVMSAADMLMMFHFYFTGNPEGLLFDVLDEPFSTGIWTPFARYLERLGVELRLGTSVEAIERVGRTSHASSPRESHSLVVHTPDRDDRLYDACVLSLDVRGLHSLVSSSPTLDVPAWRDLVLSRGLAPPFAVWRLFLDRPMQPGRQPFVGTAGFDLLDNISLYHDIETESRAWARRSGGSVVELHAYGLKYASLTSAVEIEADVRQKLKNSLHAIYPETRTARTVDERFLLTQDCPSFEVGSFYRRPTVETPFPEIALAGDFVQLPFPSALMERAAASGFLSANRLLSLADVRGEPVASVPLRGLLATV